jgi:hypothetical protein
VQLSAANNGALAKASMILDAVPVASEIDSALARQETLAREGGVGIGVASALPVSIDRLAQWSKAATSRGLSLVPISVAGRRPAEGGNIVACTGSERAPTERAMGLDRASRPSAIRTLVLAHRSNSPHGSHALV